MYSFLTVRAEQHMDSLEVMRAEGTIGLIPAYASKLPHENQINECEQQKRWTHIGRCEQVRRWTHG